MKTAALSLLAALAALGQAQNCPTGNGVGIIVARASTENPGTGIIGAVADDVVAAVPGSTITAVDYPATLQNYQQSEAQGVAAMTQLVNNFSQNCPGSKMVLMGYSQVGSRPARTHHNQRFGMPPTPNPGEPSAVLTTRTGCAGRTGRCLRNQLAGIHAYESRQLG